MMLVMMMMVMDSKWPVYQNLYFSLHWGCLPMYTIQSPITIAVTGKVVMSFKKEIVAILVANHSRCM